MKGLLESYADTEVATRALERLATEHANAGASERADLTTRALTARLDRPALDGTLTLNSDAGRALLADLDARYGPTISARAADTADNDEPVAVLQEPAGDEPARPVEPAPAPGIDRGSRAL